MLLLSPPIPSWAEWAPKLRRLRNGFPGSSAGRDSQHLFHLGKSFRHCKKNSVRLEPTSSLPHMLDHSGSFDWRTREVPSTSMGKSTEKATHMMTHTSMCAPHQKYVIYVYNIIIIMLLHAVCMYAVSLCMF